MSAKLRAAASALRAKYARVFAVPLDEVVIDMLENLNGTLDAEVHSPKRTDLPTWFVGGDQ